MLPRPPLLPILPLLLLLSCLISGPSAAETPAGVSGSDPFSGFSLPGPWQEEFWSEPDVEALLAMGPEEVAALVPEQAGFYHARCPSCEATEADDPFTWSVRTPEVVSCRSCEATFPNDAIPAQVEKAVPEDTVEVLPGTFHSYPYHLVEPTRARYPGERIYLDAKRDDLARTFLARFALYAAVRHREEPEARRDPKPATLAALILLRFAQVYPSYAVHYDQAGRSKYLQPADLRPPYREGFRSAKWDRSGALNVPMNLVIAYAMLRDDPAIDEAGRLLEVEDPRRVIEEDLLRASARFLLGHPDTHDERSIYVARGLLSVGHLLGDDRLRDAGLRTLDGLARRGFYHDGHWRSGDSEAHRRVVGLLDGWFRGLVPGLGTAVPHAPPAIPGPGGGASPAPTVARGPEPGSPGAEVAAMLALARRADDAAIVDPGVVEVRQVSWPPTPIREEVRRPALLGGVGLARLSAGEGPDAIDLELRGFGDADGPRSDRLSTRLAFGGRTVLGDLDDLPPSRDGWERSTASHNAVIVDGLNQRESPARARRQAPGADLLFFAAEPTLQVVAMGDPRAYPSTCSRYRHTMAVVHDDRARFALSVFEVRGGHQHDQLFHAPPGSSARWRASRGWERGPRTLLPASIVPVADSPSGNGRWFIQAYAAFTELREARVGGPTQAVLDGPDGPMVGLHLLNPGESTLYSAESPDPSGGGRGALIVRRASDEEEPMRSTLVTLFEAPGRSGLRRAGRVESPEGTVLLVLETGGGAEHLLVNDAPGTVREAPLTDGSVLRTDSLLVRVRGEGISMAGGTFAEVGGRRVEQARVEGRIVASVRPVEAGGLGWFETDRPIADPGALAGLTLIVSHGGEASRSWTIDHVEILGDGRARVVVVEEPGFTIDPETGTATYYQFPGSTAPGPHRFIVPRIVRSG
ncbi:heparinase II/III family protein [Tautonia plasticadhaerens]|uniref:Heparinase II/III-like protein n=1 Tax=Tautonia plasticadhaerens TaxID=2527974 RepID=A0A518GY87_9BACT|nr:heparinase II/III family protein [Tautonia plasticadhaerens]QDV33512.1 hypothetical protein ElP_13850 [Tautonia plasticadhaerens]